MLKAIASTLQSFWLPDWAPGDFHQLIFERYKKPSLLSIFIWIHTDWAGSCVIGVNSLSLIGIVAVGN